MSETNLQKEHALFSLFSLFQIFLGGKGEKEYLFYKQEPDLLLLVFEQDRQRHVVFKFVLKTYFLLNLTMFIQYLFNSYIVRLPCGPMM